MILTLVVMSLLAVLLAAVSVIFIKKSLELNEKLSDLGKSVEESLDVLDDCHVRIARAANITVTTDDPHVRQLFDEIKRAKSVILVIANKLLISFEQEEKGEN